MIENDIMKFHQEISDVKSTFNSDDNVRMLQDTDKYVIATKIDLTVSRLIRLIESKNENKNEGKSEGKIEGKIDG